MNKNQYDQQFFCREQPDPLKAIEFESETSGYLTPSIFWFIAGFAAAVVLFF